MTLIVTITGVGGVIPCNFVCRHRRFGGICRLYL